MDKQDLDRFKSALIGTAEIYSKPVTPELTKIYWAMLKELTIDQFSDALTAHLQDTQSGKYFPKPADILEKAKGSGKGWFAEKIHNLEDVSWAEGL